MGQKRFIKYKDTVDSFPLLEKNMSIFRAGRYCGYDKTITLTNNNIKLGHVISTEGQERAPNPRYLKSKTLQDGTIAPKFGGLMFPTGLIVHDDSELDLNIPIHAGLDPVTEYDPFITDKTKKWLLVAEHDYQETPGGTSVIYFIIAGTDNDIPSIPTPSKQIAIGVIREAQRGVMQYLPESAPFLIGDTKPIDLFNEIKGFITNISGENNEGENQEWAGESFELYIGKDEEKLRFRVLTNSGNVKVGYVGGQGNQALAFYVDENWLKSKVGVHQQTTYENPTQIPFNINSGFIHKFNNGGSVELAPPIDLIMGGQVNDLVGMHYRVLYHGSFTVVGGPGIKLYTQSGGQWVQVVYNNPLGHAIIDIMCIGNGEYQLIRY